MIDSIISWWMYVNYIRRRSFIIISKEILIIILDIEIRKSNKLICFPQNCVIYF